MNESQEKNNKVSWRNTIRCSRGIRKGKFMKKSFLIKKNKKNEKKVRLTQVLYIYYICYFYNKAIFFCDTFDYLKKYYPYNSHIILTGEYATT